jgi:RNA polymerase sigma-70 factor (ECF subfamily)
MIDGLMVHFRRLEKLLRRRGRSREDAEDLIQETFLRVKQYLDEGGEIREPEAFLVTTALNLSRDARKREHRHLWSRKSIEQIAIPDVGPSPEDMVGAEEHAARVKRALNTAGPRAKEIFFLHRLHGMSYQQIAEYCGLSQSAVEKYIARAVAALTEEFLEP